MQNQFFADGDEGPFAEDDGYALHGDEGEYGLDDDEPLPDSIDGSDFHDILYGPEREARRRRNMYIVAGVLALVGAVFAFGLVRSLRGEQPEASTTAAAEGTGALDPSTEAWVLGGYERLMRRRTTVVITHRLALARRCDRVVVVSGGRVVEDGPPEQLETAGASFRALFVDVRG